MKFNISEEAETIWTESAFSGMEGGGKMKAGVKLLSSVRFYTTHCCEIRSSSSSAPLLVSNQQEEQEPT